MSLSKVLNHSPKLNHKTMPIHSRALSQNYGQGIKCKLENAKIRTHKQPNIFIDFSTVFIVFISCMCASVRMIVCQFF